MKTYLLFCALAAFISQPLFADLRLQFKDQDGRLSTIISNGDQARIDNPGDPGYILIDLKSGAVSMVNPQQRQVMRMDTGAPAAPPLPQGVTVKVKKGKKGPRVAGYKTRKYHYSADGEKCGTIFGSKKMLEKKGVKQLFAAMNRMQNQARGMMAGFGSMLSACDQAQMEYSQHLETTGAPLRIVEADGRVASEVVSVNDKFKVAGNYYQLPVDFEQVSMQDQVNQARRQQQQAMQQMQRSMPDMNQLMQQMQESGQMSPEMIEKMQQRMQQMMQQYQPPAQ